MTTNGNGSAPQGLLRWLPGLALFTHYPRGALPGDVIAGASACIVMIPSVIAYADLVGVPAVAGLYAALAAMAAYALFGSGTRVIAGPDAAVALLAGAAIVPLAGGDPIRAATLAAALAMLAGGLLLVAAWLQSGGIADLLSKPVLIGYMNGVALILAATQLGRLMGVSITAEAFFPRVVEAAQKLPYAHGPTLAVGLLLVTLLLAQRRIAPNVPGTLVACAVALLVSSVLDLTKWGIDLLGAVPQGLPRPGLPATVIDDVQALLPAALGIAFLVFAEGVLLARAFGTKHREEVDANRELVALGAANVAAGALGGFAVTASQSRTAIVDSAGGRTQLAQWVAVALLVLFLLLLAPLLDKLPVVVLAAILVTAGISLFEWDVVKRLRQLDRRAWRMSLSVTLGVLVTGVVPGILLGVALSLLGLLLSVSRPRDAILKRLPNDHRFHDLDEGEPGDAPPGVLVYRLYAPLIFANARHVAARVRALVAGASEPVRCVVFDLQAVTVMDVTAIEAFYALYEELTDAGIDVRVAHANRPLREQLLRLGLAKEIGEDRFFHAAWEAVDDWVQRGARSLPPGPHPLH
jgi:sulfate permease, SulP family